MGIDSKAANDEPLSPSESERVIGLAKLIGQLEAMIEESGTAKGFDAGIGPHDRVPADMIAVRVMGPMKIAVDAMGGDFGFLGFSVGTASPAISPAGR